jgi:hypothetical protein
VLWLAWKASNRFMCWCYREKGDEFKLLEIRGGLMRPEIWYLMQSPLTNALELHIDTFELLDAPQNNPFFDTTDINKGKTTICALTPYGLSSAHVLLSAAV